jgi:hypothetical protein
MQMFVDHSGSKIDRPLACLFLGQRACQARLSIPFILLHVDLAHRSPTWSALCVHTRSYGYDFSELMQPANVDG